jgi:hypothetical protein
MNVLWVGYAPRPQQPSILRCAIVAHLHLSYSVMLGKSQLAARLGARGGIVRVALPDIGLKVGSAL